MKENLSGVDVGFDVYQEFRDYRRRWVRYCKVNLCSEQVRQIRSDGKSAMVRWPKGGFAALRPPRFAKDGLCYWHWKQRLMERGELKAGRCGEELGEIGLPLYCGGFRGAWGHKGKLAWVEEKRYHGLH